ncbi:hypothetical protein ACTHGU_05590 [Chitinophagaceae bacterium MMS25-I14]
MRPLLFILLFIVMTGCACQRTYVLIPYRYAWEEGNRFADSLKEKTDTVITYCYAPAGNMRDLVTDYFIYWESGGKPYMTRISTLTDYNIISPAGFNISYINKRFDAAAAEKHPVLSYTMSHYKSHEYFFAKFKDQQLSFDMPSYEKSYMQESARLALIDKFRSYLYDVSGWEPLHFHKMKPKKYNRIYH